MKRVMIFYIFNGLGHLKVAESIKEKCVEKGVAVEIVNPMAVSVPLLAYLWERVCLPAIKLFPNHKQKFYNQYLKNKEPDKMSATTRFWYKVFCNLYTNHNLIKKIKDFNPDIIITCSTSTNILATHIKKYKISSLKIANIFTDYTLHSGNLIDREYVDYYFVPSEDIKNDLSTFNVEKEKIFVSGIPVSMKFNSELYDEEKIVNNLGLNYKLPIVLFLCGGGLGIDTNFEYFKSLVNDYKDYQFIFVAGKNKNLYRQAFQYVKNINIKCLVYQFVENMPELLSIASVVITKPGGITITECIAMNKKMILINPLAGQEEINAKYIEKNGYGKLAKSYKELKRMIPNYLIKSSQANSYSSDALKVIAKVLKLRNNNL